MKCAQRLFLASQTKGHHIALSQGWLQTPGAKI